MYFWLIIAISIASMFVEAVHGPVIETTDTVISIISTIGFFGYVYNKRLLSKSFWKFVFIITVIEVLAFALARKLIIGHAAAWENLLMVVSIAILFAVRRFLLKRHDMVETPDGLIEADDSVEN